MRRAIRVQKDILQWPEGEGEGKGREGRGGEGDRTASCGTESQ